MVDYPLSCEDIEPEEENAAPVRRKPVPIKQLTEDDDDKIWGE